MLQANNLIGFGAGGGGWSRAAMADAPQTNLIHHYRADTGITEVTGVSVWADQKGSQNFVQATTTKQPAYSATSGANGLDGITFDGVDNNLKATGITLTQPFQIMMVFKQPTWVSNDKIFVGFSGATIQISQKYAGASGDIDLAAGTAYVCTTNFPTSSFYYFESLFSGASSYIAKNNGTPTTGNPGTAGVGGGGVDLCGGTAETENPNLIISELLIYDADLSAANITALQSYINGQYSLW